MSSRVKKVDSAIFIDGEPIPVHSWNARLANQGAMGSATASGSLSDASALGIDLIEKAGSDTDATFEIHAGFDGDFPLIFSGIIDDVSLDVDDDRFTISGRDFAAVLADGRQTMAGMNYKNQSVGQIVQQVAEKFQLSPDITDPGVMAGPLMREEHSYNPQPQSYWILLQGLAEKVGYECYVLPNKTLYFGPEKDQGHILVNYGAPRGGEVKNPGWGLSIEYRPRNNSNIVVKSLSLDPQKVQKVTASAQAEPVKVGQGRRRRAVPSRNRQISASGRSGSGRQNPAKSIYYIRCPGMTPEQAQAKCQAMADGLAKRQVLLEMKIEGLPRMKIHSLVKLVEHDLLSCYGFDGIPLNVCEVEHSFDMSEGFVTSFRALARIES